MTKGKVYFLLLSLLLLACGKGGDYEQMHEQLMKAKAQNENYEPFESDSMMLHVADYFDRNGTDNDVPYEAFIVLERIRTYNRIGTVTVGNLVDGKNMEIRLRGEYKYAWYNDPVKLQYARTSNGSTVVYEKEFTGLGQLYEAAQSGDIILEQK